MEHSSTIIAQFVLFCRGQGVVLPYDDYRIIYGWSEKIKNPDHLEKLLLLLEETLPDFYEKSKKGSYLPGLKALNQKILQHMNLF